MSNEEREKKKSHVMVAILIGTIVLGISAWRLLHHDFNIIGQTILWSIIIILIFLALVDLRELIKYALPIWEYNRGFRDKQERYQMLIKGPRLYKFNNPYLEEGKKKKVSDIYKGFFLTIGINLGNFVILLLFLNYPSSIFIETPIEEREILVNVSEFVINYLMLPLLIIFGIINIILIVRSLKKNRIYLFLGMLIPFLIGLFIGILLYINPYIIDVSPGTLLVKYPMVHVIILGSLSLSLVILFLVVVKISSKEKGADHLKGEKNE